MLIAHSTSKHSETSPAPHVVARIDLVHPTSEERASAKGTYGFRLPSRKELSGDWACNVSSQMSPGPSKTGYLATCEGVCKSLKGLLTLLAEYESHLSDKVQFLLDAVLGFINAKQNDIFKVLTDISIVGIQPTLVASIYGMNFKNMPELNWA